MKEFNIGDRVRVKDYTEISDVNKAKVIKDKPYMWNSGKAKIAGKEGTVVDKLYSEAHSRFIYFLHLDGFDKPSHAQFDGNSLELVPQEEVMRGHGHIMHDGAYGIAQASSYALLRIMKKMEGEGND